MSRLPVAPGLDHATRRALAVGLFNYTWTLLENPDRTKEQDDEMLHAAHASRYHWGEVGEAVNLSRGEWQVSRVYSVLGRAEPWEEPVDGAASSGLRTCQTYSE